MPLIMEHLSKGTITPLLTILLRNDVTHASQIYRIVTVRTTAQETLMRQEIRVK